VGAEVRFQHKPIPYERYTDKMELYNNGVLLMFRGLMPVAQQKFTQNE
jgi:hypothetical protein